MLSSRLKELVTITTQHTVATACNGSGTRKPRRAGCRPHSDSGANLEREPRPGAQPPEVVDESQHGQAHGNGEEHCQIGHVLAVRCLDESGHDGDQDERDDNGQATEVRNGRLVGLPGSRNVEAVQRFASRRATGVHTSVNRAATAEYQDARPPVQVGHEPLTRVDLRVSRCPDWDY